MGVNGLWKLISPSGRMIDIATLRGKMLAVDASIWLTQFLKAMRDDEGRMIQNGHIVGTLRRVCKLLYHRIRTVFVFDGGIPFLKKRIMEKRRQRQAFDESRRQKAARGLLANQLLLQNEAKRAKFIQKDDEENEEEEEEDLDNAEKEERARKKRFVQPGDSESELDDQEEEKPVAKERSARKPSSKAPTTESKKETIEQQLVELGEGDEDDDSAFNDSEEEYHELYGSSIHNIDLSTIKDLPREQQYNILVRLREGNRESRRDELFPVAGDPSLYSATQLKHFLKDARRKKEIVDMQKSLSKKNHKKGSRIASDWTREYTLVLDQQLGGEKSSANASGQENNNVKPVAKPDEETLQRKQQLGLFQSECVDRLYEGLDGTVDRDTCLSMLQANDFNVAELIENYQRKRREEDQKLRAIEQLFEGLGGTVDRETCRALLASNGWRVEETLLSYVDSYEPRQSKAKKKKNGASNNEVIVVDDEPDEDDLTKPENGGFLVVEEEDEEQVQTKNNNLKRDIATGIIGANVHVVGEDKLVFRFNVNDITQESLAIFADVLDEKNSENGDEEKIHESDIEWEEESVSQEKENPSNGIKQQDEMNNNTITTFEEKANENVQSKSIEIEDVDHKFKLEKDEPSLDDVKLQQQSIKLEREQTIQSTMSTTRTNESFYEEDDVMDNEGDDDDIRLDHMNPISRQGTDMSSSSIISSKQALERAIGISSGLTSWASTAVRRALKRHAPEEYDLVEKHQENKPFSSQSSPSASSRTNLNIPTTPNLKSSPRSPFINNKDEVNASPSIKTFFSPSTSSMNGSPRKKQVDDDVDAQHNSSSKGILNDQTTEKLLQDNAQLRDEVRKASRDADQVTPEMRQDVMELLRLFGMPYIESPMEAEAQCAALESAGLVDGVITDDSDAFLFGARRVYKNIFTDKKHVEAYDAEDIEQQFGLTREKFIDLALLMGSDYTEGIKGIGIVNAVEVLSAFPGEDGLEKFRKWVHASHMMADDSSSGKKKRWRTDPGIEEGDSELTIQFKKSHASARKRWLIHGSFPEPRVVQAYLKPNVHEFTTKAQQERLVWNEPDVDGIYLFCKQRLNWPDDRFDKEVLEPIRVYMNRKNVQTSMDQFVVRFEDKTRFAAIRSKRMAKAVHGIRTQTSGHVDDSIVAVDELGNVISVADRANIHFWNENKDEVVDGDDDQGDKKQQQPLRKESKKDVERRKRLRVVETSSESEAGQDDEEEEEEEHLL